MNYIYQKQCSAILEAIGFLEHYVNDESYLHAMTAIRHEYSGTFLKEDVLRQLDSIKDELGGWVDQHMPHARIWFTTLQEDFLYSMLRTYVMEVYDYEEQDIVSQIKHLKKQHEKQPLLFLRMIVALFEEDHKKVQKLSYDELLQALEQELLEDHMKWQIIKFHLNLPHILDEFQTLLLEAQTILKKHQTFLDQCLQLYLNDYATYQEELFPMFTQTHDLKLQGYDCAIIIPTIAYGNSFIFHESDISPKRPATALWGVDIVRIAQNLGASDTSEEICSVLKVLSDKSKFEILVYLSKHKTAYGAEIAKAMKLTTPTISYHMQALINAHLIKIEKRNNRLYYSINESQLKHFLQSVEHHILMP